MGKKPLNKNKKNAPNSKSIVFSAVRKASILLLITVLYAATIQAQETEAEPSEAGASWSAKIFSMSKEDWDPRAGLIYAPLMPIGNISALSFGAVGAQAYFSVDSPLKLFLPLDTMKLRTRMGLIAGYHAFTVETTNSTGSIGLIPILAHLSVYYDLPELIQDFSFAASFKWNQGIILSNMTSSAKPNIASQLPSSKSASISGSYLGYGTQWSLGVEMKQNSLPQLAYFLDLGYLLHTEDLSGTFFSINLGAAWHFYTNKNIETEGQ